MSGRTLLVASGGGHLKQLKNLADRIPWASDSRVWITVDNPHSRTLLEDEREVIFVPSAGSRDMVAAIVNARLVRARIRAGGFTHALSTGASLAVSILPLARAAGARCHFIESAARVGGPSLSGRVLAYVPGVHRYTQYRNWATRDWTYAGCVFDAFKPADPIAPPRLRQVVVTLGTLERFAFRALIQRMVDILPPATEVLWQTGCTPAQGLNIRVRPTLPAAELSATMASADVIVAHSGVGSALSALEAGKIPILVPRRVHRHEHIDDHQEQLARELAGRGLARWLEVEQLTLGALLETSTARLKSSRKTPVLDLHNG
jgi:UDP-N-acetylglucosamine--N-acetylmuramyl-(pentapeptide) pyrophosphoryl-undecaprenol N-acetylglucosamine transferase